MVPMMSASGGGRGAAEPLRPGVFRTLGRFLIWTITVHPRSGMAMVALEVLAGLVPVATVWIVRGVLDASRTVYDGTRPLSALLIWLGLWAGVTFVQDGLFGPWRSLLTEHLRQRLEDSLLGRLQEKAHRLRLEAFERPDFHDVLGRARAAAEPGRMMNLLWEFFDIARGLLTVVSVASLVGGWSPMLLVALIAVSLPAPIAQVAQARSTFFLGRQQTERERLRNYLARILTSPGAAKEVRTFDLGPLLLGWWERIYWTVADVLFRQHWRQGLARAGLAAAGVAGLAGGIAWSAWGVSTGALSTGEFAGMLVALQAVRDGVGAVVGRFSYLSDALLHIADLYAYLALGPEEPQGGELVGDLARADISLRNVRFRYPQSTEDALKEITFTLRAGERVALVGENGSGKTTLVKVMIGLFQPTEGQVLYGGRDLAALDLGQVRDQTAAVFQDHIRYAFTLQENIGYGRAERVHDRPAVEAAAAKGGADAVAAALPAGYDTLLTREFLGGTDLSGGQWQRVAVSRGFMREAPLIVLDEPTAALDPNAEADVFRRFAAMAGNRTAVLVSHRLGSARLCDRVLVLKGGRLVEQGSHAELVSRGGEYARMWALQAQWYAAGGRAAAATEAGDEAAG